MMLLMMVDTKEIDRRYRTYLEEYLRGKITYIDFLSMTNMTTLEIDSLISDVIGNSIKKPGHNKISLNWLDANDIHEFQFICD